MSASDLGFMLRPIAKRARLMHHLAPLASGSESGSDSSTQAIPDPEPLPWLNRLSDEYLVLIFEQLASQSDLHAVCLTSKRFYACAIRTLYRNVQFNTQAAFFSNMHLFWRNGPGQNARMKSAPQEVTMRKMFVDEWERRSPWRSSQSHHSWDHNNNAPDGEQNMDAVHDESETNGCTEMFSHLLSFSAVKTLVFEACRLPDRESLSLILLGFPRLLTLVIQNCTFMEQALPLSHSYGAAYTLPLTSLTLAKNTINRLHQRSGAQPITALNMSQTSNTQRLDSLSLQFALAPNLTTLEVTWDDMLLEAYTSESNSGLKKIGISPSLHTLTIYAAAHRSDTDFLQLVKFIQNECENVRWFEIRDWHRDYPRGEKVLPNLECFTGAGGVVSHFVHGQCREIHLTGPEHSVGTTTNMLANVHRNVAVLTFTVSQWDNEVLYAVSQMFDRLEELRIHCRVGHPDEDTLLVMSGQFFSHFKDLRVLHIYEISRVEYGCRHFMSAPAKYPRAQEMRGLWWRACPKLVEAQWSASEVLKRVGGEWAGFKLEQTPLVLRRPDVVDHFEPALDDMGDFEEDDEFDDVGFPQLHHLHDFYMDDFDFDNGFGGFY